MSVSIERTTIIRCDHDGCKAAHVCLSEANALGDLRSKGWRAIPSEPLSESGVDNLERYFYLCASHAPYSPTVMR